MGKEEPVDDFNRAQMLTDWADLIIIPGYENYVSSLEKLVIAKDQFIINPSSGDLTRIRDAYLQAYTAWQRVAMFEIGKAEAITIRNYTNIYPTDTEEIERHVATLEYNLELPSTFDAQGFPALDYLLYGLTNKDLLSRADYGQYMSDLIDRLIFLADDVLRDWKEGYRDDFISNDGSSATASVDKMVNDFLFHYERFLRAGKIGIPAGVFSGSPIPDAAEAPYSEIYAKGLFDEASSAMRDFFLGRSFDGSTQGISLEAYLDERMAQNQTADISEAVLSQWSEAISQSDNLENSLKSQVVTDNTQMLMTYDELQKLVIIFKVDMMQALNIQVDYIDADGD